MVVLIIEDVQAQIELAKRDLAMLGFKIAVAKTLEDAQRLIENLGAALKGIITDLHFPESSELHDVEKTSEKPNGLAIIADAVVKNIPVAVCSDINHHFCGYAKGVIDVLSTHQSYSYKKIPFIMDKKDWSEAGRNLLSLINNRSTQ